MQNNVLAYALFCSLVLHLVLVGCFRIRLFDFGQEPLAFSPVTLVVENDPAVSTLILDSDEKKLPFVSIDEISPQTAETRRKIQEVAMTSCEYPSQSYPLKIKYSQNLKQLLLIEDGSHLFKDSSSFSQKEVALLKSQKFTIEYRIKVDGSTGTLFSWKRTRELLDKKLQRIADKIISSLRFIPYKQSLSGKLWLTFYCTGEELSSYLKEPITYD